MKRYRMAAIVQPRSAAAAVLLGFLALSGCRDKGGTAASPAGRPPVTGVEVAEATRHLEDRTEEAAGTVRARTVAPVSSRVMGTITSFPVAEGSRVAKGDLLASIDDAPFRTQVASAEGAVNEAAAALEEARRAVAQAEAGKSLAERTQGRLRKLHEEKAVTRQEFEEAETKATLAAMEYERALEKRSQAAARVVQARAQATAAATTLSYAKITAPFSGVVTEKKSDLGAMAVPGTPLLVLEDTSRYRLEASVPESRLSSLRVGSRVRVELDAVPGKPLDAVVSEIAPSVDPASRTLVVKADIPSPGLRTGMYGRMRFPAGKGEVLSLPRRAVSHAGGYESVFVISQDNVARLTMVTTAARPGDRVEVLSGLAPGSRVAVSHVDRLFDGARVEVRR